MAKKPWFSFESKAPDNATVLMYGVVGADGLRAADFLRELDAISASKLKIRMHSPGGNVFDGMMIYEGLKASKAEISIHVDGVAASIASTICMAGTVTMSKTAMMMVHRPYSTQGGNSEELASLISALDQIDANMVAAYSEKTRMTPEEIRKMMKAETWMNAERSKALGFCDSIGSSGAMNAAADFSILASVPDEVKAFFSEKEPPTERELEQILRDAGVSNSRAKAAVAAIKGEHRDDDSAIVAAIQKAALDARIIAAMTR